MVLPTSADVNAGLALVGFAALHMRGRSTIAQYNDFKSLTHTIARQRYFRSWLRKSLLLCGVPSLFGLLVVDRFDALWTMPSEFSDVAARSGSFFPAAFLIVSIALVALAIFGRPQGRGRRKALYIGDIEALLPRNDAERCWAVLLSLNAALSEELFFRLALPLLLVIITGQAGFALALSCILFGLGHAYQGRAGILGATVGAVLLTMVYLESGSIWVAVSLHAAINLKCMLLPPLPIAGVDRVALIGWELYSRLRRWIGR